MTNQFEYGIYAWEDATEKYAIDMIILFSASIWKENLLPLEALIIPSKYGPAEDQRFFKLIEHIFNFKIKVFLQNNYKILKFCFLNQ